MDELRDQWKKNLGLLSPVIDFNSCETKGLCGAVCPHGVLDMMPISDEELKALSFFAKLKTRVNGREKAYVVDASLCNGCGLCVAACPEKAIKLAAA